MNPLEIFGIIFDRRHIKDVRLWTLTVLFIGFAVYHWQVIKPLKERQDRQGKRIHQIIFAAHLSDKIAALEKDGR